MGLVTRSAKTRELATKDEETGDASGALEEERFIVVSNSTYLILYRHV
jgi:hypothetical protein